MHHTTLDELIEQLQQSRKAAGKNLPVRLKIEVQDSKDEMAPDTGFVSVQRIRVLPCIADEGSFTQITAVGAQLDC